MVKRKCKHCGEILFSSDTGLQNWVCPICYKPIPKSEQKEIYEVYEK